ncbi:hypothetical protein O6H91_02G134300 [Diphasiastrum complanatum]|uniref:Uncharacterized protein n=3 Tax=Diphasiastrum complanatum TaxID=34168 RepID=A0ACC2EKX1_DIPCM|nr:hypothetical protein O6H91_02G134300 [Diphasiastrum complanatum]KAJ7567159.1 hypothetical protein O6H91_02G134300 [Diphasiastrum complanatum]
MDNLLVPLGILLLLIFLPLLLWAYAFRRSPATQHHQTVESQIVSEFPVATTSQSSGTRRMRRRTALIASSSSNFAANEDEQADDAVEEAKFYVPKASKKKEVKKQEKEARRQAEVASQDSRREKQDRHAEMRRRKDEEREAKELEQEEEARRQKAKEEEVANEEFEKWKGAFSVDMEGSEEQNSEKETQSLLSDFVDYIKKHKCVALEDLAAEFNLRVQDVISRVTSLEKIGRISGVMDDRGKFIYISPEEMRAVADYIKRVGRVSISHLANKSNEFIDFEPKVKEGYISSNHPISEGSEKVVPLSVDVY